MEEKHRIVILLLAAGNSSRFGPDNKLLAPIAERPMLIHSLRTLQALRGPEVLVVLGHQAEVLVQLLDQTPHMLNPCYPQGLGSSIAAGIAMLTERADAVLIALADQVALTTNDYCSLLDRYILDGRPVCARFRGHLGIPALIPCEHFPPLRQLKGDPCPGDWLAELPDLIPVDLPRAAHDIDTPADLNHPVTPRPRRRTLKELTLSWWA